jgi:hypothetical protein
MLCKLLAEVPADQQYVPTAAGHRGVLLRTTTPTPDAERCTTDLRGGCSYRRRGGLGLWWPDRRMSLYPRPECGQRGGVVVSICRGDSGVSSGVSIHPGWMLIPTARRPRLVVAMARRFMSLYSRPECGFPWIQRGWRGWCEGPCRAGLRVQEVERRVGMQSVNVQLWVGPIRLTLHLTGTIL